MKKRVMTASTPEEMEALAASLATEWAEAHPREKWFIALRGDLGAGKTVFVRGFASVISPGSRVKSPTYVLVNEYRRGAVPLFHFDLYRAEEADDLASLGMEDYVASGHCIVEWSEYLRELPQPCQVVTIEPGADGSRQVTVEENWL